MSVFYFISTLSILFALLVVFAKNPIHSVLYLIITFFTFTVHYILLNAQFLAVVNFIVYMGAIMVLFLFVIMLLNLSKANEPVYSLGMKTIGVISGACFLVTLLAALKVIALSSNEPSVVASQDLGLVKNLGKVLFNEFLLPFELSSVLLLSAMVGAILLAKKEKTTI